MIIVIMLSFSGCSEETIDNLSKGKIAGKVVVKGANTPLGNVKISTNPSSSTVFTNDDGEFLLEDVVADQYSVQAEKEGYLTSFEGVKVQVNTSISVVFEMEVETAKNKAPNVPQIMEPSDMAIDVDIDVQLKWVATDPENDKLTYELEIRNDKDNEILKFSNIEDTLFNVTGLRYGLKYFWQVSASDAINEPAISAVNSFETLKFPANRFLFVRQIEGNNVIFSADANGNELQLTPATMNSWRPRKNLAKNKIAFLATEGSKTHIYTMDPDGSNIFKVTSAIPVNGFNLDQMGFSWSKNGSRLIYPNFDILYTINSDGSGLQEIYKTLDGSLISECVLSEDDSLIVLKTNDVSGYGVSIYTINSSGTVLHSVLENVLGAAGGLDITVDNKKILYWYDVSGFENATYRQLNSSVYLHEFASSTKVLVSSQKQAGFNDIDPRFSPNDAEVIFMQTSNDGISQKDILKVKLSELDDVNSRTILFSNAEMPDWE
ncbi:carboxypeptidase-like regulatory domain-containing protein [Snuella sedimenti]|uniref:Carboxypeptidase regulatory-like domain-containing protein n=1 Tax=Snuella sedimenti TaxID=2798802 RepID=A0A8J7LUF7_9FLAO|nr:carboxypeptidase-like regulatory domain-containing protein [Snuella sedimenti]MBJ6369591.1 carboxypeptidase regulatory-like domain-containing protein [Snuella sedimenti]